MITGEIKNQVDRIWESFWSGGITNPMTVIKQFTYLLFIKRLDELHTLKENRANRTKKPIDNPVFSDKQKEYRWSIFKDFEPEEMFDLISQKVFPFIKNLNGNSQTKAQSRFSKYMKDALFQVPTPALLAKVVDSIDKIPMKDKDTKGDLYEYLLSKLTTAGVNGQFRTPRHIIKMMVELMRPTPKDTVCDPACGTAGFLVAASEYLEEHYPEVHTDKKLKKHYQSGFAHGFDFDPSMLRIGSMNLVSHGIEDPFILYRDSLTEANADFKNEYTLILANPPFKGSLDHEAVANNLISEVKTKKTELLFLVLMIRLFKLYAGVSTAVLLFTKTNSGGTDNVWFYDMDADGYSLDDKRDAVDKNDIPDILKQWKARSPKKQSDRTSKVFHVPADEIRENKYDLSINRYKEMVYEAVEYEKPQVILDKLIKLEDEIMGDLKELKGMIG